MYSLWKEPWILTDQGEVSPELLLNQAHHYADLRSGHPHQDAALLRLLILLRSRQTQPNIELFGDHPFLQVPPDLTETLNRTPLHALHLTSATGRDVTLLTPTFDASPRISSFAEAARILTAFQLFAPSRGLTAWNPSKDAPLARSVTFHAIGETLGHTLALNTPPGLEQQPAFWESPLHTERWRSGDIEPLTLSNLHAFPWRSVTLEHEGSGIRWVRQASGVIPQPPESGPWPDPHTLGEALTENDKRQGTHDRLRSPGSREVYGALVSALTQTLLGDPLAPVSFQQAKGQGAKRVRATSLCTRSGQPVVLNLAVADLPWPRDQQRSLEALQLAQEGLSAAVTAGSLALKRAGLPSSSAAILTGQLPSDYWQRLWPTLSLLLAGNASYDEIETAVSESSKASAQSLTAGLSQVAL